MESIGTEPTNWVPIQNSGSVGSVDREWSTPRQQPLMLQHPFSTSHNELPLPDPHYLTTQSAWLHTHTHRHIQTSSRRQFVYNVVIFNWRSRRDRFDRYQLTSERFPSALVRLVKTRTKTEKSGPEKPKFGQILTSKTKVRQFFPLKLVNFDPNDQKSNFWQISTL